VPKTASSRRRAPWSASQSFCQLSLRTFFGVLNIIFLHQTIFCLLLFLQPPPLQFSHPIISCLHTLPSRISDQSIGFISQWLEATEGAQARADSLIQPFSSISSSCYVHFFSHLQLVLRIRLLWETTKSQVQVRWLYFPQ
jgi:hypothetical protein